jgi:hypothetical protein
MFGHCFTQLTDIFQERNGIYSADHLRPRVSGVDGGGLLVGECLNVVGSQRAAEVDGDAFAHEHAQRATAFRDAPGMYARQWPARPRQRRPGRRQGSRWR